MRAVAGAEPTTEVAGLANRYTTKMCANAQHDQPFGLLYTILVGLGVSQGSNVNLVGLVDLVGCSVSDEDGLSSPFDDDVLAFGDGVEIDLDLGHSQDVGRGRHVLQEFLDSGLGTGGGDGTHGTDHEV